MPLIGGESDADTTYWSYTMNYNSAQMSVTNGTPLSYGNGMSGMTPVDNSSSTLGTATTIGSWDYGCGNDFIDSTFYATFTDDGRAYKQLDPDDLTKYIDGSDASSDIRTMNVLWCVPTIYWYATSTTLTITNNPSTGGTAYAHTIDGTVYDYIGYGVYEGTTLDGKLMSISNSTPTASTTSSAFRTQAASTFSDTYGESMLWNFYQWELYKYIVYFSIGGFNSQAEIGNGRVNGSVARTGDTNSYGVFAGSVGNNTSSVKAYIENAWGSLWEWVDDFNQYGSYYYAGQNSAPTDSRTGKTVIISASTALSGYVSAITTSSRSWGWGTAVGGSYSSGLTDNHWNTDSSSSSRYYALRVGGTYNSGTQAGVGHVSLQTYIGTSNAYTGARLAYVFDADAVSNILCNTATFISNGSVIETQTVQNGMTVIPPEDPTLYGYAFRYWSLSENGTEFDLSTPITEDITLHAVWDGILAFQTEPVADGTVTPLDARTVLFSSTASIGKQSVVWDFGDGTTSTNTYATKYYSEPGTYTVALTVYNDIGASTTWFEVEISDEEGTGGWGPYLLLALASVIGGALIARRLL